MIGGAPWLSADMGALGTRPAGLGAGAAARKVERKANRVAVGCAIGLADQPCRHLRPELIRRGAAALLLLALLLAAALAATSLGGGRELGAEALILRRKVVCAALLARPSGILLDLAAPGRGAGAGERMQEHTDGRIEQGQGDGGVEGAKPVGSPADAAAAREGEVPPHLSVRAVQLLNRDLAVAPRGGAQQGAEQQLDEGLVCLERAHVCHLERDTAPAERVREQEIALQVGLLRLLRLLLSDDPVDVRLPGPQGLDAVHLGVSLGTRLPWHIAHGVRVPELKTQVLEEVGGLKLSLQLEALQPGLRPLPARVPLRVRHGPRLVAVHALHAALHVASDKAEALKEQTPEGDLVDMISISEERDDHVSREGGRVTDARNIIRGEGEGAEGGPTLRTKEGKVLIDIQLASTQLEAGNAVDRHGETKKQEEARTKLSEVALRIRDLHLL